MKIFITEPRKCTGCRLCELACSFSKHGAFGAALSNIRVESLEEAAAHVPVKCLQCEGAPCLTACVTGALYKDAATGAVLLDRERCIGCRACLMACPFGCVSLAEGGDGLEISICDLCAGDPECVKVCREGALSYVEEGDVNRKKRENLFRLISRSGQ